MKTYHELTRNSHSCAVHISEVDRAILNVYLSQIAYQNSRKKQDVQRHQPVMSTYVSSSAHRNTKSFAHILGQEWYY